MGTIFALALCSSSSRKELVPSSGTVIFAAAAQRTPLYCLALVANWAHICGSNETNKQTLADYHP